MIIMMITVVVAAMAKVMIIIHFLDSVYAKKADEHGDDEVVLIA